MCLVNKTIKVVRGINEPTREGKVISCDDNKIWIRDLKTKRLYQLKWPEITVIRIIEAEAIKPDKDDDYEIETGDFYERQTSWDNRD